ncbi:MAG: GHMP kinase [Candidatus Micrarchaeota archaeon]
MLTSKSPLRISFFGGGTDFHDYYKYDYGCVLSTTIDKYVYIMVNRKFDERIQLNYRLTEIVDTVDEILHPTIRESMRFTGVTKAIELSVQADFPSHGTGLGSSSSFLVGLINALSTLNGKKPTSEELAKAACQIEIEILKEPIGKQDQYISAYGGFNFIKFNKDDSVTVEPVKAKPETLISLNKKLLFFYTGIGRSASRVLKEQKETIEKKIEYFNRLRDLAVSAKSKLEKGDLDSFGEMLDESWQIKKTFASGISSDTLDNYYKLAMAAGAKGGKILGAGGGGFFMFFCDEHKQDAVRKALTPMREVKFSFPSEGSKIVFNDRDSYV